MKGKRPLLGVKAMAVVVEVFQDVTCFEVSAEVKDFRSNVFLAEMPDSLGFWDVC